MTFTPLSIVTANYVVLFERRDDGYYAWIPDVPNVGAIGRTLQETQDLIREALMNQGITLKHKDGEDLPEPTSFAQYLRIPVSEKNWLDRPALWKFVQVLNKD